MAEQQRGGIQDFLLSTQRVDNERCLTDLAEVVNSACLDVDRFRFPDQVVEMSPEEIEALAEELETLGARLQTLAAKVRQP